MNPEEFAKQLPSKRLKPLDGLAVTADLWEEAHEYHRHHHRLHALLAHGVGIVTGLEVIASDPADDSVYILPGIAIDPAGNSVILTEPVAFDFGRSSGLHHLILSYGEGPARSASGSSQSDNAPLYIHGEFSLEGIRALPGGPILELARVRRSGSNAIRDARKPNHPAMDEIDLRFRPVIGASPREPLLLAVCYAGGRRNETHASGANRLAKSLRRSSDAQVWVDENVPLDRQLSSYTMVYLVGEGSFQLSLDELESLYNFVQHGGTVLLESCRRGNGEAQADALFGEMLESLGISPEVVTSGHPLLAEPYLFSTPPVGYVSGGQDSVREAGGIIWSTCDYGCLWHGDQHESVPSREDIRSAVEWGANLLAYARQRRSAFNMQKQVVAWTP